MRGRIGLRARLSHYPPFFHLFNEILLFHDLKTYLTVCYSACVVNTVSVSVLHIQTRLHMLPQS